MKPIAVIQDREVLSRHWPYTAERLVERLSHDFEIRRITPDDAECMDWTGVRALALFEGALTSALLERAQELQVVGGITDARGPDGFALLVARRIPFVEATRAWAPSVAECGLALALCALRRIPQWHMRLVRRDFDWVYPYGQFCDDPRFVNGELGTKTVGVVGLGQIGSRLAAWSHHLGARVLAYDPYAPQGRFDEAHATPAAVDELVSAAEVLFVAVPPTPSAVRLISADRVRRLRRGAIVVTITRTDAIDTEALRTRVLRDELVWAADVFDREPLLPDDPLLGRDNVIHIPHIAGRTRDANLRLADILADDFLRVLKGEAPKAVLSPAAVAVRTGQFCGPEAPAEFVERRQDTR
jgi:phosphoglycerate dehydrogenase-like enzyme